jgi:hypothetical protein
MNPCDIGRCDPSRCHDPECLHQDYAVIDPNQKKVKINKENSNNETEENN